MLLPALPSASGPFVGPGDRYPNRQLKTKSVPVWLLADSQPHSLHSLKRFFWRRSIVINHFGSKGASPALPSAPPCTEARRGPILARKRWASGIAASTLSSSGAGPNPCSPTTKPEFPKEKGRARKARPQGAYDSANIYKPFYYNRADRAARTRRPLCFVILKSWESHLTDRRRRYPVKKSN